MRRREFIVLLSRAAVVWSLAAWAQQPRKNWRIGITTIQPRTSPPYVAFDQRLRELGYVEGKNLTVDFLNPDNYAKGVSGAMTELVRRKVDIIVAPYEDALKSALAATDTLPIVMIAIDYDPLALGYIKSLARKATMFWDSSSADQWLVTNVTASSLGLRVAGIELREQPYDYEQALVQAPLDYRSALIMTISSVLYRDRQRLADFALRHRMASIFALREWVDAGGLLSYGASFAAIFRRAAEYVDKIAKGAKVANLPIEQPTKFELVVNLKTAKALGITIPPSIMVRADEVIE
jgi:putative ABC transport system substrate-binding protein